MTSHFTINQWQGTRRARFLCALLCRRSENQERSWDWNSFAFEFCLWSSSSSSFPRQALALIQNITCSHTLPSQRSVSWWRHFSCSFPVGAESLDHIHSVLPEEVGHFLDQVAHWWIAFSSGGATWIGMLLCIDFSMLVQSIPVTWTSSEAYKTPFQKNGGS